uniref:Alternative protein PLXDC1 n=1 Tax=Homo sapiens TaxID=9606 RepID=L8EA73_HUMAN|nr:alternative protein PLXDC1 [Homo sapiens]
MTVGTASSYLLIRGAFLNLLHHLQEKQPKKKPQLFTYIGL